MQQDVKALSLCLSALSCAPDFAQWAPLVQAVPYAVSELKLKTPREGIKTRIRHVITFQLGAQ